MAEDLNAGSWGAKGPLQRQRSCPQRTKRRADPAKFHSDCTGLLHHQERHHQERFSGHSLVSSNSRLETHSEEPFDEDFSSEEFMMERVYCSEPAFDMVEGDQRRPSRSRSALVKKSQDPGTLSPSRSRRVEKLLELHKIRKKERLRSLIEPRPIGTMSPEEVASDLECEEAAGPSGRGAGSARGGGNAAGGLISSVMGDPMRAFLGYSPLPRDDPEGSAEVPLREEWPPRENQVQRQAGIVSSLRRMTLKVLQSITFQILTVSCIIANAMMIGLETDMPHFLCWEHLEMSFLGIFALEVSMRLFVHGPRSFFCGEDPNSVFSGICCDGAGIYMQRPAIGRKKRPAADRETSFDVAWNIFDFGVLSMGCMNQAIVMICATEGRNSRPRGSDATLLRVVRLLRLFRLLRIVRVVRFLKPLYLLAYGFLEGAMAVFWVAVLGATMIYFCALLLVRAYHLKSPDDPGYDFYESHFYSVPGAMFTLFEIMASPTLSPFREVLSHSPLLAMFIVVFVIFGSFGMNGLLTGVISESIMEKNQARLESMRQEREAKRRLLESCCAALFDEMVGDPDGTMNIEAFKENQKDIASVVNAVGASVPTEDLDNMFMVMDYSDSGSIDKSDFVRGVLELCEDVRPMSIMEIHSQVSRCQLKIEQNTGLLEKLANSLAVVGVQQCATPGSSTAPATFSAERGLEGRGARSLSAVAESGVEFGTEQDAGPAGGGGGAGAGAAELAALAALQRRLGAAAQGGGARAAGELAQLGRQLARLVQDNADLVAQCLVAQDGRSAPGTPGAPDDDADLAAQCLLVHDGRSALGRPDAPDDADLAAQRLAAHDGRRSAPGRPGAPARLQLGTAAAAPARLQLGTAAAAAGAPAPRTCRF